MHNSECVVRASGLGVRYDAAAPIFEGLDFQVGSGEFVCLLGRSGVGKSTLLHAIGGFIPHEGILEVRGRIGAVLQDQAVFPWETVEGNIAFGLDVWEPSAREVRIESLLQKTGLTEHRQKYPAQLSGGQLQRVAVARAIAPQPELLLMDEPFSALDPFTREEMQDWLLETWIADRRTVIFVTHDVAETVYLAERMGVLQGGRAHWIEGCSDYPRPPRWRFSPDFALAQERLRSCLPSTL